MSSPFDSPRRFVVGQRDPIIVQAERAMSPYDHLHMSGGWTERVPRP